MGVSATNRTAVVIEDDPDIRDLLRTVLTQSGFDTIAAPDGPSGIEAVRAHDPIVTTLDVAMPGMDGFAVASRLREFSQSYIIMLTGQADEIDVIQGLQAGADDDLVKPFRPRELRVRIEALMRRPRGYAAEQDRAAAVDVRAPEPAPAPVVASPAVSRPQHQQQPIVAEVTASPPAPVAPAPVAPVPVAPAPVAQLVPDQVGTNGAAGSGTDRGDRLEWHGLAADPATRIATVDGRGVELTRSEFDLLVALLATGRRVRSKADLVLTLRGESYVTTYYVTDADKRAVEVHMANLRRKIGDSSATPRWIETVRGVGYRLAAD